MPPVVNKRDVKRDITRGKETWQVGQTPVYQELDKWEDPRNLGCSKLFQACRIIYRKTNSSTELPCDFCAGIGPLQLEIWHTYWVKTKHFVV